MNTKKQEIDLTTIRCQKCLQMGHWTYQCTGKRKYVRRLTRTQIMKRRLKQNEKQKNLELLQKIFDEKTRKKSDESSSDSTDSESDSSSSDSGSESTSSDSSGSSSSSTSGSNSEPNPSDKSTEDRHKSDKRHKKRQNSSPKKRRKSR